MWLINEVKIGEKVSTSKDGRITWVFAVRLSAHIYNPITTKKFASPWFCRIPAGGFHFMGLRVTWGAREEIEEKRVVRW